MNCLRLLCSVGIIRSLIIRSFTPKQHLPVTVKGLHFRNPVGLGAGFDKNARYLRELSSLGFGFVEIGTVTPIAQTGNDKPRLFRLKRDRALINRMGFNNNGVKEVVRRLKKWREGNDRFRDTLIVGGNIGKNKVTPNEEAWKDYETCFTALHPYVDYFVVNVSSPNTPGLRELQDKESLRKILSHLISIQTAYAVTKPIFLKIAPDLSRSQLDDVIALAKEIKLDGIVATNTTISREGLHTSKETIDRIGAGGLSGKPVQNMSTEVVKYICANSEADMPVIASGGIETGSDALEKLNAGAKLVQVWTGFIYEGPAITRNICRSL